MKHNWAIIGIIVVVAFLLSGCATCRDVAMTNARHYQDKGYDVRISAYCVGAIGRIVGMGLWSSHVQAQVWDGAEWLWVGEFGGLHKTPTYSTRPMIVSETETYDYIWWSLEDYKSILLRQDEILRETPKSPCDLF